MLPALFSVVSVKYICQIKKNKFFKIIGLFVFWGWPVRGPCPIPAFSVAALSVDCSIDVVLVQTESLLFG